MANGNQLKVIADLVDQLTPLRGKQRGMRIEADEWNALVGALLGVLEIDRTQEEIGETALEQRFTRVGHQHLGEVQTTWLDTNLQAGLAGGGSSVASRAALAEMDKRLTGLGTEVARLTTLAENQQKLLDRTRVDELDRGRALRGFEERFTGVENLRTLATTLSSQVEGLTRNVDVVLDLRKTLTDAAGNPIDIGGLQNELRDVEALRDNLRGVDGDLLRLRDIEIQLREIEDVIEVGGGRGLDQRFAGLSAELQARFDGRLDERAGALRSELLGVDESLSSGLRGELAASLEASRAAQTEATRLELAAAETRINAGLDQRVGGVAEQIRAGTLAESTSLVDQRLAGLNEQIGGVVNTARAEIETTLRAGLASDLETQIGARLAEAEARLGEQLDATRGLVDGLRTELDSSFAERLAGERVAIFDEMASRLDTRLAQVELDVGRQLDSRLESTLSASLGDLDARIAVSVEQSLSGLDNRIGTVIAGATSRLPEEIRREVGDQLGALDLERQLETLRGTLTTQFRADLGEALAAQQAQSSSELNAAVGAFREELEQRTRSTLAELGRNLEIMRTDLRDDLTRTIDERLRGERPRINAELTRLLDERLQVERQVFDRQLDQRLSTSLSNALRPISDDIAALRRLRRPNG